MWDDRVIRAGLGGMVKCDLTWLDPPGLCLLAARVGVDGRTWNRGI